MTRDGRDALVVRSSSVVEDASGSSMAGQFRSVLDVLGWPAFLAALVDVLRSADRPRSPGTSGETAPMAVLVQPQVSPHVSGFLPSYDDRCAELFAQNLERYLDGAPLMNLVDRARGY